MRRGLAAIALGLLVCCSLQQPALARDRASLDFNWRFQLNGGALPACKADAFPINLNGQQCYGLSSESAGSEEECQRQCCNNPSCEVWQWCPPGSTTCSPAPSCWTGHRDQCQDNKSGWVSMGRNSTGPSPGQNCTSPYCQPDFDDSKWRLLNLPHDFVVEGTFGPNNDGSHGFLPKGTGWYRRHFQAPAAWANRVVSVLFDGVYRNSQAWLNGQPIGTHVSGYTSFRLELPQSLLRYNNADNVLVVYADATANEGWWYEGGGIYRHTWLETTDVVYVDPWELYAPATAIQGISADGKSASSATVTVFANITNAGTMDVIASVQVELLDASGLSVAKGQSALQVVKAAATAEYLVALPVASPKLWLPAAQPYLYTLVTRTVVGNATRDEISTTIGIRQVTFDANTGLFVNNQPVKVKGLCNHQDFAGLGTALPDRVNEFRVRRLQDMGANGWRMSHNPPNPELLDFTDKYGMLVWDENRNFQDTPQYRDDVRRLITRDRNHPSIFLWSLCNEGGCMEGANDDTALGVAKTLSGIIRTYDPFRKISAAWNAGTNDLDYGWGPKVLDVQGINYNYGEIDQYHKMYPEKPMISSETASCTCARGIYYTNDTAAHKSVYSADGCAVDWWTADATRDFMQGGFAWTGFDYKGETTPYKWPCVNSNFGILDMAGFPKDTYYYYLSWWRPEQPTLHLVPSHWNSEAASPNTTAFGAYCYQADPLQQFTFDQATGALKTKDGLCIDAACANVTTGCVPVQAEPCTNSPSQRFTQTGGVLQSGSGGCLDLWNNGKGPGVGVYRCDGSVNQKWTVDTATGLIRSGVNNTCLSAARFVTVWAYSNQAEVELKVNNISRGRVSVAPLSKAQFGTFPYTPGSVSAVAYRQDGSVALSVEVPTTGPATRLVLEQEFPKGNAAIDADGQDVALLTVYAVDSNNNPVATAGHEVTFTSSDNQVGRVIGVGNGDPSDHSPDKGNTRKLFNGLARCIVQSTALNSVGQFVVTATSNGLQPATLALHTQLLATPVPRVP
eukprot:TRINITY_DN597_c0_g2_i1.p1 TRINITY_DN597_c0_g2~~TRINITY_DN597_c0_g2_i1.p1  ORF type:complete len:1020 (+),score=207.47 TRINITY_DN597_c0_g2_i1:110-3169(+)